MGGRANRINSEWMCVRFNQMMDTWNEYADWMTAANNSFIIIFERRLVLCAPASVCLFAGALCHMCDREMARNIQTGKRYVDVCYRAIKFQLINYISTSTLAIIERLVCVCVMCLIRRFIFREDVFALHHRLHLYRVRVCASAQLTTKPYTGAHACSEPQHSHLSQRHWLMVMIFVDL